MVQNDVRAFQTALRPGKELPTCENGKAGNNKAENNKAESNKAGNAKSGNFCGGNAKAGNAEVENSGRDNSRPDNSRPDNSRRGNGTGCRRDGGKTVHLRVVTCVTDDFAVTADDLGFGSRGSPHVALARQVAMYLCHTGFALSFGTIGRLFGRDRTTVAHACRVIEERRDDIWFDCRIAALEQACGLPLAQEDRR